MNTIKQQENILSGRVLCLDESIKPYLVETDLWVQKGMEVHSFKGANETIGTLVLNFPIQKDRDEALKNIRKWLKIIVN